MATTIVIWTIAEMIYAPASSAYATTLAPERYRGRYMGIWHSTWSAGMLLGPFLGTLIYEKSPNALWLTCLVLGAIAAALAFLTTHGTSTRPATGSHTRPNMH